MNARKKLTALFVLGAAMVLLMLAPGSAFVQSQPVADSHAKALRMFDREADTHLTYEPRANTKSNRAADDPQRVGRDANEASDGTRNPHPNEALFSGAVSGPFANGFHHERSKS